MVLGIVLIAVGLGICGFAHLIRESTHRLHYVIGVVGVGIAGLGILLALRGLFCALTGESLEGRQKPKD